MFLGRRQGFRTNSRPASIGSPWRLTKLSTLLAVPRIAMMRCEDPRKLNIEPVAAFLVPSFEAAIAKISISNPVRSGAASSGGP